MKRKTNQQIAALTNRTTFRVRFSEIDSMQIVWHGEYVRYFEDGREAFGKQYGLDYMSIYREGYMVPIVDLTCQFKQSLSFGEEAIIETRYLACEAAKIKFEYVIYRATDQSVVATGSTIQVFLNLNKELELINPPFYLEWKRNGTSLNIYITAHTLISSLGFDVSENRKAIHDYRSGIRMQEAGRISDSPILAGMIDSAELEKRAKEQLEKRAKELDISSYTRLEQLFILTIQEVISQSGVNLQESDCALLLSTTKGNIDLLSNQEKRTNSDKPGDSVQSTIDNPSFLQELSADSPTFLWKMAERIGHFLRQPIK